MARVKGQHLGKISGKVGDLIYKTTNSGSFVFKSKRIRKSSNSKAAKDSNDRFTVIVKFTNAIHDSMLLKKTWTTFRNIKGNRPYDKIHSFVSKKSHTNFIGKFAHILPDGIFCDIKGFEHDNNSVEFVIKPTEELINLYKDPFSAVAIIYLNTPVTKRKGRTVFPENSFIMVEEDFDSLGINGLNNVKVKFENYENKFSEIYNYQRVRVYISVFFNDGDGKVYYTNSDSFLYKGHDIDNAFYEEMAERIRQEKEDAKKPQMKFRSIKKR